LIHDEVNKGIWWSITDEEAITNFDERIFRIRDAYHINFDEINYEVIHCKIRTQLRIGYREGFSINQIADRIKTALVGLLDISMDQAFAISKTEIIGSNNYSKYLCIKKSGYRKKEWYTAIDEKVRPLHQEMHGRIINVGNVWKFSDGNFLRYPGDHEGPDHLVVNCRCIEVVVPDSHELFMNNT
jgi:hypothetical protein